MGRKVIGRAFRISDKAARSYDRARPGKFKANPLGVTAIARVNGRGAYSARAAAKGRSRSERLARARKLAKGESMQKNARAKRARFVSLKKNPAQKRRSGKRLAAYNAARRRGMSGSSAARSALRKVPFTANERRAKTRFGGVKARMRPNRDTVGEQKKYEEGWDRIYGKKKADAAPDKPKRKRASSKKGKKPVATKTTKGKKRGKGKRKTKRTAKRWPKQHAKVRGTRRVKTTKRVPTTRKARVAYGPYRRARLFNPRTGRKEYSYYYRTKKGTYRRIPAWAVAGAKSPSGYKKSGFKTGGGPKQWARTKAARERAAARVLKEGGVFTPNKRRAKKKGSRKRSAYWAAYRRARAAGATKTEAKRLARGEKKMARRRKKTTKRRSKARKAGRRTTKRRTKKRTAKRRGTRLTKRQKAARKAARTRKRNAAARSRAAKKGSRKRRGKRRARKTTARRGTKRRSTKARRRSGKRRMRKNSGRRMRGNRRGSYRRNKRRYRRNQGFAKTAMEVVKFGALVAGGFLAHRLLTSLAAEHLLGALTKPAEGEAASEGQLMLAKWSKPLAGVVVAGVGVALVSKIKNEKARTALGAGMVASVLQSAVVTILMTAEQPKIAAQFEGYSNSMAYQLRGNRRRRARAMRGLGAQTSIMPRYQQVGFGAAPFMQAAAGTGEYFQANSVGEYFAPTSTQGVGAYEAAGPLAMQAAAGTGQVIEDGIRPDDDLDRVLDLAESAAGLGAARRRRGMGEYYSAQPSNGGYVENRVPTQSQWIPNGPLWAGTLGVKDTIEQSELPAGILAGPGGNGTLSGG